MFGLMGICLVKSHYVIKLGNSNPIMPISIFWTVGRINSPCEHVNYL